MVVKRPVQFYLTSFACINLLLCPPIVLRVRRSIKEFQRISHDQSSRSYVQESLSDFRRQRSSFTLAGTSQCELHPQTPLYHWAFEKMVQLGIYGVIQADIEDSIYFVQEALLNVTVRVLLGE